MFAQSSLGRLSPLALLIALGCSSNVNVDDGEEGGGGEGGQGGACTAFADAEPSAPVTFRFSNQSGQDVYLPASCDDLDYSLTPQAGETGTTYGRVGGACQQSCEELQTEEPILCDAAACAASAYRLQTGDVIEIVWDGRGQAPVEMPLSCWESAAAGTSCTQIVAAPAGSYSLSVRGFSECGDECECDANGLCSGTAGGQEAFPNAEAFSLPGDTVVEVVFETCAFGCPG